MRQVFGDVRPYRLVLGLSTEVNKKIQVATPEYSAPSKQEAPLEDPVPLEYPVPLEEPVVPAAQVKPSVEVDDALARSLEFLGAEVAEIRDLNGNKSEELTDESGFLADPETPPEYTQDSLF